MAMTYAEQIQQYASLAAACLEQQIILAALNDAWQMQHQIEVTNILKVTLVKRNLWPADNDLERAITELKHRHTLYEEMIDKSQLKLSDVRKRGAPCPPTR